MKWVLRVGNTVDTALGLATLLCVVLALLELLLKFV